MGKNIVGLIPVKGQSERVRSKNTRPFHNTNLLELKLQQLQSVKGLKDIIVSSENDEILETALKHGYSTHERNSYYSKSTVPMSEVYSHVASEISGEHIAWINVTNPLAEAEIYNKAISTYNNMSDKYNCLLSVFKVQENLFYQGKPVNFKPNPWPRSQDLEGVCAMSFVINLLKREDMMRWGSCVGNSPFFFYVDPVTSTDIDFQEDFDFCEIVYKQRHS